MVDILFELYGTFGLLDLSILEILNFLGTVLLVNLAVLFLLSVFCFVLKHWFPLGSCSQLPCISYSVSSWQAVSSVLMTSVTTDVLLFPYSLCPD